MKNFSFCLALLTLLATPLALGHDEEEKERPVTTWPQENATVPTRPLDTEKQAQEEEAFAWDLDEDFEEEDYVTE